MIKNFGVHYLMTSMVGITRLKYCAVLTMRLIIELVNNCDIKDSRSDAKDKCRICVNLNEYRESTT